MKSAITENAPSLLKWVGGKSRLLGYIATRLRKGLKAGGCYIEPFLGSGAVFFDVRPKTRALLGDVQVDVVEFFRAIRDQPHETYEYLKIMRTGDHSSEYFAQIRSDYNSNKHAGSWGPCQAARFIYLNRRGFNGLWRVNRRGECNTPPAPDSLTALVFPSRLLIEKASRALQAVVLLPTDFEALVTEAKAGDLIYADPPYDGAAFDGYSVGRFTAADQVRLACSLQAARARGVAVLASNLDTPRVRELYQDWAELKVLPLEHLVGGKGSSRLLAKEVLIEAPRLLLAGDTWATGNGP